MMFLLNNIFVYFSALFWVWEMVVTGPNRCFSFLQTIAFSPFRLVSVFIKIPSLLIFATSIYFEICYYMCKTLLKYVSSSAKSGESPHEKQIKLYELKGLLKFDQLLHENPNPRISVIIPCYNEAKSISETMKKAMNDVDVEIIIADGGSTDDTLVQVNKVRGQKDVKVMVHAGNTRSECLNAGAAMATGEILLFLHADTILPHDWGFSVRNTLSTDKDTLVGAFAFKFHPEDAKSSALLKIIEWGTNLRSSYLQLPYGDQALFCYKNVFTTLGKFPVQLLMEDYDFVLNARSVGKVYTLPLDSSNPITTSARRWRDKGIVMNTLWNTFVIFGHTVGVPTSNLARWYYGPGGKKAY